MPAVKKDPSARARTNRASSAAVISAVSSRAPETRPSLPDIREWHRLTVEFWDEFWASGLADEQQAVDRYQFVLLATLYDDFFAASSPSLRMKLFEQIGRAWKNFGLTAYGRRQLEYTIEQAGEAQERGVRRRQGGVQPASKSDPRSILHAV